MTIEISEGVAIGRSCASAVRLGLLSQEHALACLATRNGYGHQRAVEALLPVLDEDGMMLLLTDAEVRKTGAKTRALVASRLAAFERWDDALGLTLEAAYRPYCLARLFPALQGAPRWARDRLVAAVREDVEAEIRSDDPDLDVFVDTAPIFERDERVRVLEAGLASVDRLGDGGLFWDSFYDERDPRLRLAEAFFALGKKEHARALLERVRKLPHPFADAPTTPDLDLLQTWLRCGEVPDDLFESITPYWRLRARLELSPSDLTRLGTTRLHPSELPTDADDWRVMYLAIKTGVPDLGRRAAEGLMALVEKAMLAPGDARSMDILGRGTLEGLGTAAPYLSSEELTRAIDVTRSLLDARPGGRPSGWQVLGTLYDLLPHASPSQRTRTTTELLTYAMEHPTLDPPLSEVVGWELLLTEEEQRAYLTFLLQRWVPLDGTNQCDDQ